MRPKTRSYLTDNNDENKKARGTKNCSLKIKLKVEYYKYCLESTQLENKINQLEKYKLNIYIIQENHKEFIKKHYIDTKTTI